MRKKASKVGLVDNTLKCCPNSPNCVVSENADAAHAVAPFEFTGEASVAWDKIIKNISDLGGEIKVTEKEYLWATFTSRIMRYVDDLELRLDAQQSCIHVRSASRVGYHDLGANRKRVEQLRQTFTS